MDNVVEEIMNKVPHEELQRIFETFDAMPNCGMTFEEFQELYGLSDNDETKNETDE